ncbi:phage major capsid protein [Paenibacillus sp. MWE-103]|uniref:Phage major capsid protein n=1 Tax=Paenibacillus artemisiicola TaxID=1172618 RepID=A0ABS3WHZ8_9BACL|nr:phage major capsid protein [Paenibacillus artemisiicola]MBO7747915.1 phage major capsid protein [Paenibacillus artemisiicola]
MKMELRFNQTDFEANSDGSMTVSGYVNKTNQYSELIGRQRFREKIAKGAFSYALQKAKDIHFLAEHDSSLILASTRNGSLTLREDDQGLFMSANISPTSWGKDYYELIRSGILRNMSFGFKAIKDAWKKVDGIAERTVHELELFEVSVVRDSAYSQSTISARGIDVLENIEIPSVMEDGGSEMNKKALIEERNDLQTKINELNKQLGEKEVRNNMIEVYGTTDKDVEQRGLEQFFKGQHNEEEYRAITTGAPAGSLAIPTSISDEIVKKLLETGQLVGRTKIFPSQSGYLEVLRETNIGEAGFVGEMENINPTDYQMDKVKLEQKRVGTAIELSQQLINDAAFDITAYATDVLIRRIARTIDRNLINGDPASDQFEGILNAALPAECSVTTAVMGSIGTDDLMDMFNSIHPQLVEGAVWIMNRKTFSGITKLKDGNNQYYLADFKNGVGYTMLGLPILISDAMPDSVSSGSIPVILVNLEEAVAVMIKKGLNLKHINADTTQALRGSSLFVADIYMDAKILNTQAIRVLKPKSV